MISNHMAEKNSSSSPFFGYIKGRKIDTNPLSQMRPDSMMADKQFEQMTENIKRLSGTFGRYSVLPPVPASRYSVLPPAQASRKPVCTLSPLENCPLSGEKINIQGHNSYAGIWHPSEASPDNTAHGYVGVLELSNIVPAITSFHQKPWCDLLKLSCSQNGRPTLNSPENQQDSLTVPPNIQGNKPEVLNEKTPSLSPTKAGVYTFYQENGVKHSPIHMCLKTDTVVVYSVSGHEPIRARQKGETPQLSVFHLYQTEISPDSDPVKSLTNGSHPVQVEFLTKDHYPVDSDHDLTCEQILEFPKVTCSEASDIFYSIVSTGSSSVSLLERLLQDDVHDHPGSKNHDVLSASDCVCTGKLNAASHCDERKSETTSTSNLNIATFTETCCCISQSEEPAFDKKQEADMPEIEDPVFDKKQEAYMPEIDEDPVFDKKQEAYMPEIDEDPVFDTKLELYMPQRAEEPCRQNYLGEVVLNEQDWLGEVGLNEQDWLKRLMIDLDVREGYTFCEANLHLEEITVGCLALLQQPKLKRPPPTTFTFSKINTSHIQSEDRRSVMKRLTKLPLRCKQNSLKLLNVSNSLKDKNYIPSRFSNHAPNLRKDTPLAKINLELDFRHEERRGIASFNFPTRQPVVTYIRVQGQSHHEETAEHCPDTSYLNDAAASVSPRLSGDNVTSVVLSEKSLSSNQHCEVASVCDDIFIRGSSSATSTGNVCETEHAQIGYNCVSLETEHAQIGYNCVSLVSSNNLLTKSQTGCTSENGVTKETEGARNVIHCSQNNNTETTKRVVFLDLQPRTALRGSPSLTRTTGSMSDMSQCSTTNESHKTPSKQWRDNETDPVINKHHYIHNKESKQIQKRTLTSLSAASFDGVPHNSPVESCHGGDDQASPIKSMQKCSSIPGKWSDWNYDHSGNNVPKADRLDEQLPERSVSRRKPSKSRDCVPECSCLDANLAGQDNLLSRSPCTVKHTREHTALSVSADELSPPSQDSSFSCFGDSSSESTCPASRVGSDCEDKSESNNGNIHLSESNTFGPHFKKTARIEKSPSQYHSDFPKRSDCLDNFTNQFHDNACTDDTLASCTGRDRTREIDINKSRQEKACQVCKNVRFSDEDKIISFRNKSTTVSDNVRPVSFYTTVPKINQISATLNHERAQSRNQVTSKQTGPLHSWMQPRFSRSQMMRTWQAGNPLSLFRQATHAFEKPHPIHHIKWSANSKMASRCSGDMFIKGRSLASKADADMAATSETGVSCGGYHAVDAEDSVMYTICHKCEKELHVKFGSTCSQETGCTVKRETREDTGIQNKTVSEVQPSTARRCGHRHEGYCPPCAKVMAWALSARTGEEPA